MWGISVISKRIICNIDMKSMIKKYGTMHFIYPTTIFCALANVGDCNCVVYCHNCFTANKLKKNHAWEMRNGTLKIWSKDTVRTIDKMPHLYDRYKKNVWENCWNNNGFLTRENLKKWNKQGYFNFYDWLKNLKYLSMVTHISKKELLLISLGK